MDDDRAGGIIAAAWQRSCISFCARQDHRGRQLMETPDLLTDDGLVVLLLCSSLGCGDEDAPYTLAEWNQLAAKIHGSELKRPAALAGRAKADLVATLGIETDERSEEHTSELQSPYVISYA